MYHHALEPVLPIPPAKDPVGRAFGWHDLAVAVDRAAAAPLAAPSTACRAADRYQEASEIAFYGDGHPETFSTNLDSRPNQFDLWLRFPDRARPGDNLVLALPETNEPHVAAVVMLLS